MVNGPAAVLLSRVGLPPRILTDKGPTTSSVARCIEEKP